MFCTSAALTYGAHSFNDRRNDWQLCAITDLLIPNLLRKPRLLATQMLHFRTACRFLTFQLEFGLFQVSFPFGELVNVFAKLVHIGEKVIPLLCDGSDQRLEQTPSIQLSNSALLIG